MEKTKENEELRNEVKSLREENANLKKLIQNIETILRVNPS